MGLADEKQSRIMFVSEKPVKVSLIRKLRNAADPSNQNDTNPRNNTNPVTRNYTNNFSCNFV
jgi:hypothetical protein